MTESPVDPLAGYTTQWRETLRPEAQALADQIHELARASGMDEAAAAMRVEELVELSRATRHDPDPGQDWAEGLLPAGVDANKAWRLLYLLSPTEPEPAS